MSFDLWTLGFQAVNVLVLIWLLQRFFWTPVAAMIVARQESAQKMLDSAAAERAKAEAKSAEIAATRAGIQDEQRAILDAARLEAEAARDLLLQDARAAAQMLQDTAKAARVRAAETLKQTAIAEAQGLAVTIASRLMVRLDGAGIDAAFLGWLAEGLATLSDMDRKALAGATITVVCAKDADIDAKARITETIAGALGTTPDLTFRTDPDLIAGLELHAPHVTLRNSWRADLDRIAAALADKDAVSDAA